MSRPAAGTMASVCKYIEFVIAVATAEMGLVLVCGDWT